ncbi:MAG: peptidase M48, partial [Cyanobacteria bacterium J06638_38]
MNLSKKALIGLNADRFRHPLDLQATNTLKQLPGIDIAIRSVLGSVAEQFFYLNNIASSILVSEKQLPDLHKSRISQASINNL